MLAQCRVFVHAYSDRTSDSSMEPPSKANQAQKALMAVVTARLKKYEDTQTALTQLQKEMAKSLADSETFVTSFTEKGDFAHYISVLTLRREVLRRVNLTLDSALPKDAPDNGCDESRPRSETSQSLAEYLKALTPSQLAMLPISSTRNYKTLPELNDMRASCLVANSKEDLEKWSRSFSEDFNVAKQLQVCVEQSCKDLTAAESARKTKLKREADLEKKRMEAEATKKAKKEQKEKEAESKQGLKTSPQKMVPALSIFDLPTEHGLAFTTVPEKDFLKMSDSEKLELSSSPLIIRGCTELKEALAKVPRLQTQMDVFAPQYATSAQAKSTGRRVTNANAT